MNIKVDNKRELLFHEVLSDLQYINRKMNDMAYRRTGEVGCNSIENDISLNGTFKKGENFYSLNIYNHINPEYFDEAIMLIPTMGQMFSLPKEKAYYLQLTPDINSKLSYFVLDTYYYNGESTVTSMKPTLKIKTGGILLLEETLLHLIKEYPEYFKNKSDINFITQGCFGKIKTDVLNSYFVSLEEAGSISVERAKGGRIKSVEAILD